jgi:5-formyltetrahydrofolate cyclo-ligase
MSKNKTRADINSKLKLISPASKLMMSAAIAERLFDTAEWRTAAFVLAFMSLPEEVDTRPILERAFLTEKQVYVPRMEGEALVFHRIFDSSEASVRHAYGMLEPDVTRSRLEWPAPAALETLVIVPGLAFDRGRNRLGRGKGYYDRFLRGLDTGHGRGQTFIIGLCFHEQLLEAVPHTADDVGMDAVLTDREIIR